MVEIFNKFIGFVKKAFFVFIVFFIVINLFFYFITKNQPKTTSDSTKENRKMIYQILKDPKLTSTKQGKLSLLIYRGALCNVIGEACSDNPEDGDKNFEGSIIGFMTKLVVMPMTNPPSSGIYWAYSGLQNAGFIPKTFAAEGIGFAALAPFKEIWLLFRNLIFLILVIVIIAIGFMIMFRMKINPQTVISVENALPKIVISMILITFSYAIAGFLIDLMYIMIGFVIILMSSTSFSGSSQIVTTDKVNLFNMIFKSNRSFIDWVNSYSSVTNSNKILMSLSDGLINIIGNNFKIIFSLLAAVIVNLAIRPVINAIVDPNLFGGTSIAGFKIPVIGIIVTAILEAGIFALTYYLGLNIIMYIILAFSLLFIIFRIFFMLLSCYINTLFLIIFSPLILALECIPGKSSFSIWIKGLILNLMTFPITILLILLVNIMLSLPQKATDSIWIPPLLLSINPTSMKVLISAGIFFMIPDLIKSFRQLLGDKPMPISLSFGSFFAGGQAAIGGTTGMLGQISSISLGLTALTGKSIFNMLGGKIGSETQKYTLQTGASLTENAHMPTGERPGEQIKGS